MDESDKKYYFNEKVMNPTLTLSEAGVNNNATLIVKAP